MRSEFISYEEIEKVRIENKCGVYAALDILAPWSSKNARVCGVYHSFESWDDMKSGKNKNKKTKAKKEYKPRVIVRGNTGTRVICSKKDKQNTRQALKLQLKNYY